MNKKEILARLGAHKHVWPMHWSMATGMGSKMKVFFRCACGAEKSRKAWKREREQNDRQHKNSGLTHVTWHKAKRVIKKYEQGYPLMEAMERFALKHPKDVLHVGVDDDYHANSDVYLIDHKVPRDYMGTSVLFIPQCTGEKPISFFLYPFAANALIKALKKVVKKHTKERY